MNAQTLSAPVVGAPPRPEDPSRTPVRRPSRWHRGWAAVLRPGVRAMRRLTMTQRLAVTAGALLVPMLLMMVMFIGLVRGHWQVADQERVGLAMHERILAVVLDVQQLRAVGFVSGEAAASVARQRELQGRLRQSAAELDRALTAPAAADLQPAWLPLRDQIEALLQAGPQELASRGTSDLVERLRQFVVFNGEVSGMLLDPEARSFFLMEVVVLRSVPLMEAAALARDEGGRLLNQASAATDERLRVLENVAVVSRGLIEVQQAFEAYERAGGRAPGSWTGALEAGEDLTALLRISFGRDAIEGNQVQHRQMAEALLRAMVAVHSDAAHRLHDELSDRIRRHQLQLAAVAGLFGFTVLALAYVMTVSTLTVRGALSRLQQASEAVAGGDLSQAVVVHGRDEVAQIGASLSRMTDRLSLLVAQIRSNAAHVSMAGGELAEGSSKLSQRTQAQGDCLRQAADAVSQLSRDVAAGADEATELDLLTQRLHRRSQEASAGMHDAVQAMQAVQVGAEQVAAVVAVIDDLAFQTGMLALNASIEAARAGAAGQRFAIVAGEVRHLATRSAESADEIRNLVGSASDQVRQAASRLNVAGDAGRAVGDSIVHVSKRLQSLAEGSRAHSAELARVNAMIGDLDELTKDNARMVEFASTASHTMLQRADALREAVAAVRLQQGSADEARALVDRALSHWQSVGRARALEDFNQPEGDFVDRDLYIAVIDRFGTYSAFGLRPDLVGRALSDMDGVEARSLLAQALQAADAGGGWIHYEICNPRNGELQHKDSWVAPLSDGEMMLCGVFRASEESDGGRQAASWKAG